MTDVTSYTEMIGVIRIQVEAMGVRSLDFDDLAGFPAGLWGKVSGMLQVKRLGPEKLFDAMRAAGLRIRIEVDPEQQAKMKQRIAENFNPRQQNQARPGHSSSLPSSAVLSRVLRPLGKIGGKARWAGKSKRDRSDHMRMMVMAREKKRRMKVAHRARLKARKRAQTADLDVKRCVAP